MIGRDDLDAIRARWLAKQTDPSDVAAVLFLFDELEERLEHVTRELDEAREAYADARAARWHSIKLRDEAQARVIDAALIHAELVRERDEARAEVERLRAEAAPMNEHFTAGYRDGYRDAYRRGAEAMRVEVMQYLVRQQNEATVMVVDTAIKGVHKLPIPEEP